MRFCSLNRISAYAHPVRGTPDTGRGGGYAHDTNGSSSRRAQSALHFFHPWPYIPLFHRRPSFISSILFSACGNVKYLSYRIGTPPCPFVSPGAKKTDHPPEPEPQRRILQVFTRAKNRAGQNGVSFFALPAVLKKGIGIPVRGRNPRFTKPVHSTAVRPAA